MEKDKNKFQNEPVQLSDPAMSAMSERSSCITCTRTCRTDYVLSLRFSSCVHLKRRNVKIVLKIKALHNSQPHDRHVTHVALMRQHSSLGHWQRSTTCALNNKAFIFHFQRWSLIMAYKNQLKIDSC